MQIPSAGLEVFEVFDQKDLQLATEGVKFLGKIHIGADIKREPDSAGVLSRVKGEMSVRCSRCLDDFSVELDKRFSFIYPIDKKDHIVNVLSDIRDEIILGYSFKYLCSPGCKGICAQCGKNLNKEKCNH